MVVAVSLGALLMALRAARPVALRAPAGPHHPTARSISSSCWRRLLRAAVTHRHKHDDFFSPGKVSGGCSWPSLIVLCSRVVLHRVMMYTASQLTKHFGSSWVRNQLYKCNLTFSISII